MKIFLDTADIQKIKFHEKTGLIDGITTNPSNLSAIKKDPTQVIKEICTLMKSKDVSVEVTEQEPDAIYKQAHEIASLSENVVVKIPCSTPYYPVIHTLVEEKMKINVTLVFTLAQGLYMAKLGVRYISPFVGRWDDIDVEGKNLLSELRVMIDRYQYKTKILAASLRTVRHLHAAIAAGADIATLSGAVFEKSMDHILTQEGIDIFQKDWHQLKDIHFPNI